MQTPLRSSNGYYLTVSGRSLMLSSFVERRAQNTDGSGYSILIGQKFIIQDSPEKIFSYMRTNNIKCEKECSIVNLPEDLIKVI